MPSGPEVLVLGATGGQGGAVAAALLAQGTGVRALVRDPRSSRAAELANAGVTVVAGSFTDVVSLRAAMSAVSAVFAVTTPFEAGPLAEVDQGMAVVAAAVQADVPFLVYSSVAGALSHTGVPHFESKAQIEQQLARQRVRHMVLAPTYFYDNLTWQIADLDDGFISLPLPATRPLQQLDRGSFGQVAASILVAPRDWMGQRLEVAADAPTGEQMATALQSAAGRPVRYEPASLTGSGAANADMAAMWTFLNTTGYQVDIAALASRFPNVEWTSFAQWAKQVLSRSTADS